MTGRRHSGRRDPSRLFPWIGLGAALVLAVGVYLSWQATNGLPGQPTYVVNVEVPSANRVIDNNEVRIAGVRVGRVAGVRAVPAPAGAGSSPYARITLKLEPRLRPLTAKTRVKIRPASVLGATYVDLVPGRDGPPVPEGGTIPQSQASETVELTDLLDVFDRSTSRNLQRAVTTMAGGVAGRGDDLGETVSSLSRLMGPLSDVTENLAAPRTRLGPFIRGYANTMAAVGPVADQLGELTGSGAQTFGAIGRARKALGETLDGFPASAEAAIGALTRLRPALEGLSVLAADLEPAAARLPGTLGTLNSTLDSGVGPFERTPAFAARLTSTLDDLRALTRLPQTTGTIHKLDELFTATGTLLERLTPAQVQCNVLSLVGEGWASAFSFGQGQGPSMALLGLTALGTSPLGVLQNAEQIPNYHVNYLPNSNHLECESGNEPFDNSRRSTSNPPGLQANQTARTFPPPGVRDLAAKAGLLATPPGANP